jgi:hypothetical protein
MAEQRPSGLSLQAIEIDSVDSSEPVTARDTSEIATKIRSLSNAFEPASTPRKQSRRPTGLQLVGKSLIEERFTAAGCKFSEDDEEAIIIKVDKDQWQIGFSGDDGPR